MINLYALLPRIVREKDRFLNAEPVETTAYIFATLYSRKTNPDQHYGMIKASEVIPICGLRAQLLSENVTEHDITFQLAVNGILQTGAQITFPAGQDRVYQAITSVAVAEGDFISLYCVNKGEEKKGVFVEFSYAVVVNDTEQTLLRKLLACFDWEAEIDQEFVNALTSLIDIDDCPEIYLPYISYFLSFNLVNDWSIERKRQFLKCLGYIYHHSGQKITFEAILNIFGYPVDVIELYKSKINETSDWFRADTPLFVLKKYGLFFPGALTEDETLVGFALPKGCSIAGIEVSMLSRDPASGPVRVYLTINGVVDTERYTEVPTGSDHAYSTFDNLPLESTNILGFMLHIDSPAGTSDGWIQVHLDVSYVRIGYYAARIDTSSPDYYGLSGEVLEAIENVRPIHVLWVQTVEEHHFSDGLSEDEYQMLLDETSVSADIEINEILQVPDDLFNMIVMCGVSCEGTCKVSCQVSCEAGCEAACEAVCETGCKTNCQLTCKAACEGSCQNLCKTDCQNVCMVGCQIGCQISCQVGCQELCESVCEGVCQVGCQVRSCESVCQQDCMLNCMPGCQVTCEAACQAWSCQISCEGGCQVICQHGCESLCEVGCESFCQYTCEVGFEP